MITRDEFIDGYVRRSNLSQESRTATGIKVGRWERVAVPCFCGDRLCDGWAMISNEPDAIAEHALREGSPP